MNLDKGGVDQQQVDTRNFMTRTLKSHGPDISTVILKTSKTLPKRSTQSGHTE